MLWLAADMDMGGMDMTDFRMISAGAGLMMPTTAPWHAIEFVFVFAMWAVMMVGMMTPSAAPISSFMRVSLGKRRSSKSRLQQPRGLPAAIFWPGLALLCCNARAVDGRTIGLALAEHGKRECSF